jgi:hypothetical protein
MSKLQIQGRVQYPPGAWGTSLGVPGARVDIVEAHTGGAQETIGSFTSDASGDFDGQTSDWQRSVTTPVWIVDDPGSAFPPRPPRGHWGSKTTPDPTDVMLLTARVSDGAHQQVLPFVLGPDGLASPPLIVPWAPTPGVVLCKVSYTDARGAVHAQDCATAQEAAVAVRAAVDAHAAKFTIDVYAPEVRDPFAELLRKSHDERVEWLRVKLGLPQNAIQGVWGGDDVAVLILAIAVLVLAVGAAIFLVLMGLAVIYALHEGYKPIGVDEETDTTGKQHVRITFGA